MKEPKTKKMKLIYKAIDYSFIKEEYIKNTYSRIIKYQLC